MPEQTITYARASEPKAPAGAPAADAPGEAGCRYRIVTVAEAVREVASARWDIPEFQRRFVWQPAQVCALADSLWRNYPIGGLLLWNTGAADEAPQGAPTWIADGQQRLTALCLMYGMEPPWVRRMTDALRARLRQRFDLRFDVEAASAAFVIAQPGEQRAAPRLIPVANLLALDLSQAHGRLELERLADALKRAGCCRALDAGALRARLGRVCMIGRREVAAAIVGHDRDGVLEIFARLNSRGMRFRRLLLKMAMEQIPAALRSRRRSRQP